MSTSLNAALPIETGVEQRTAPRTESVEVYNLLVLVKQWKDGGTSARAANLPIPEVQAVTVREALASLVNTARQMIATDLSRGQQIPWISPALEPEECESRFMVPLHL